MPSSTEYSVGGNRIDRQLVPTSLGWCSYGFGTESLTVFFDAIYLTHGLIMLLINILNLYQVRIMNHTIQDGICYLSFWKLVIPLCWLSPRLFSLRISRYLVIVTTFLNVFTLNGAWLHSKGFMVRVSITGMVVSLKTNLRFLIPGKQGARTPDYSVNSGEVSSVLHACSRRLSPAVKELPIEISHTQFVYSFSFCYLLLCDEYFKIFFLSVQFIPFLKKLSILIKNLRTCFSFPRTLA